MFGFIRNKIKAFKDAFSESAEEEIIEEAPVESVPESVADVEQNKENITDADRKEVAVDPEDAVVVEDEVAASDVSSIDRESVRSDDAAAFSDEEDSVDDEKDDVRSSQELEITAEADVEEAVHADAQVAESESVSDATVEAVVDPAKDDVSDEVVVDTPQRRDEPVAKATSHIPEETPAPIEQPATKAEPEKKGFRQRFMGALTKRTLSDEQFDALFADLEIGMLEANTAYDAVQAVKENLREHLSGERVSRFSAGDDVVRALKASIAQLFEEPEDLVALADEHAPLVIMLIGINGSGKTTTAAKLARAYQKAGKRPVLAAADTFRAAAIQQLEEHADALGCRIIKHDYGADPAAVAFDAIEHAKSGKADVVLIDTAGRLHSNENLLKELEKVKRVAKPHRTIFVGESIAGNDLLEQAETFNERIGIDGIILTKSDVDESGGGALSVSHVTKKPIDYLGAGQSYDDLEAFSVDRIAQLLGLE